MSAGENLLIDTGFFIALLDERDPYHEQANQSKELLGFFPIIIPWPVLYETVNTRLTRKSSQIDQFNRIVQRSETVLLDDTQYRDIAYQRTLQLARDHTPMSLVDVILCSIIEDVNVQVKALLTFNRRDFVIACMTNRVEILD